MAIVKMNRFTLLTFEQHKQPLLKALQTYERVHFKRLQKDDFEGYEIIRRNIDQAADYENGLNLVNFAAGKLKPYAGLPTGLSAMTAAPTEMSFEELDQFTVGYDYASICKTVQELDERQKTLKADISKLKAENDNLRLWTKMDVSLAEIDQLKTIRYSIGAINKKTAMEALARLETAFPNAYLETLQTIKDDVVFFIACPAAEWDVLSEELKNVGFTKSLLNFTGIPSDKIESNQSRIAELEKTEEKTQGELAALSEHYKPLMITADYFRTALERARSCENFMNLANVLIIEGWAPAEDSQKLTGLLDKACQQEYYLEETPVEPDDMEVPICLKNNGFFSAFEDITGMYSLPKYNEIDPTPLLAPFYMLFFGIMVGDAGYGLLLLAGTAVALKFLNLKKGMRNFIKFFFFLSFAIIAAGTLFGSMFGFPFFTPLTGPDGAPKAILDSQIDIVTMIVLSIVVGVVQVLFGIGVKGYMLIRDGKWLDAIFDSLFWIIALLSGIGLILGKANFLPSWAMPVCGWGFGGSLVGLALTQGRSSPSIGGKIGSGLYGVYGITGYVGDLVSYTRLVALSLSGAYIAYSFNLMAGLMPNLFLRIVAGGIILVLGQSLNVGLALLGAYVHTCRLQYVEFFGKFYEGGGVPFKPLSAKNDFVSLKKTS